MPWELKKRPEPNFIEISYTGNTTAQDLTESTSEIIKLQKNEAVKRILVDATEMKLSASIADVYNLPAKQYVEEGADRNALLALIQPYSPKEMKLAKFYEIVCINRALKVKIFSTRQEAIDWLNS